MWNQSNQDLLSVGSGSGQVYRPEAGLWLTLGLGAVLFGGLGLVLIWIGVDPSQASSQAPLELILGVAFIAGAALLIVAASRWATILYPDRIERRGLLATRSMRKAEIAGYRRVEPRNGPPYRRLTAKSPDVKGFSVYEFGRAAAFNTWFATLPDLDVVELAAAKAALMARLETESSPLERDGRLRRLKQITYLYSGAAVVAGAWCLFWPVPYPIAVGLVAALPIVMLGLVWWSKGLIGVVGGKTDPRPNVSIGLFVALPLALRALDQPILDVIPPIVSGLMLGAVYLGLALWVDPKSRALKFLLGVALAAAAYGWSVVVLTNRIADTGAAQSYQSVVTNRWVSHGRSTSWHVEVAPWGPIQSNTEVDVTPAVYHTLPIGQPACVTLHPGALSIRWYQLQACPREQPPSAETSILDAPDVDQMANLFPERASRENVDGRARFRCIIGGDGRLNDCAIISEIPEGYGFGDATLKAVKLLRFRAVGPDGRSTVGTVYSSAIDWRNPSSPAAPTTATPPQAPPPDRE